MAKGKKTNVKDKKGSSNKKNIKKLDGIGGLDSEIWGKIFIVIIVFAVLGLFYLLTLYITNKDSDDSSKDDTTEAPATISYNNIIAGRSFDMSDDDYLVIYYDNGDEDISSTYSSLVSSYKGKEDAMPIYTVDMSSAFNKSFITTEESNKNPTNASEFLINGPTLIHFSNHEVSEYIEGESDITSYLS